MRGSGDVENEQTGKKIRTAETVFDVVEAVRRRGPIGVTELADELEKSKSTVHAHLLTLTELDYLVREGDTYRLGLPFLTLGGHTQNDAPYGKLYKKGKPEIDQLADQTEERAQLMVEEQGSGFYLYQASGSRAVETDSHIGKRVPLYSTAAGKVYLSRIPEAKAGSLLDDQQLTKQTENTITDRGELMDELAKIRESGTAFDNGERVEGVRCVAAPVVVNDDRAVGAVSISVPEQRASRRRFEGELTDLAVNAARVIGLNTTYS